MDIDRKKAKQFIEAMLKTWEDDPEIMDRFSAQVDRYKLLKEFAPAGLDAAVKFALHHDTNFGPHQLAGDAVSIALALADEVLRFSPKFINQSKN